MLNWRGKVARYHAYFEEGRSWLGAIQSLLYAGAALKILGLELWTIVLLTPLLVVGYTIAGWFWVTHGWYRQRQEITALERWNHIELWRIVAMHRILKKLEIDIQADQVMPEEVRHILASHK